MSFKGDTVLNAELKSTNSILKYVKTEWRYGIHVCILHNRVLLMCGAIVMGVQSQQEEAELTVSGALLLSTEDNE